MSGWSIILANIYTNFATYREIYDPVNLHNNPVTMLVIIRHWYIKRFGNIYEKGVLLPGKSHGWRSLVGCSPWGR